MLQFVEATREGHGGHSRHHCHDLWQENCTCGMLILFLSFSFSSLLTFLSIFFCVSFLHASFLSPYYVLFSYQIQIQEKWSALDEYQHLLETTAASQSNKGKGGVEKQEEEGRGGKQKEYKSEPEEDLAHMTHANF